jgi:hypothetical protein
VKLQVFFLRLIQSQPQTGPASAESLKNDPQGLPGVFVEDAGKHPFGLFGDFHLGFPFSRVDGFGFKYMEFYMP